MLVKEFGLVKELGLVKKIRYWKKPPRKTSYSNEQKKMLAVLHGWRQARVLLKVEVLGYEGAFQSFLLNFDLENGFLILDELFPVVPMLALFPGQRLKVTVEHKGAEYIFDGICARLGEYEGLPACWLEMPARLTQVQRRQAFRVPLVEMVERHAFLSIKNVWVQGVVEDVSNLGVGIELLGDWRGQLAAGDIMPARMEVEGILNAELNIKVQRMAFRESTSTTLLGATFLSLSSLQRSELTKRLVEKQRLGVRSMSKHLVA